VASTTAADDPGYARGLDVSVENAILRSAASGAGAGHTAISSISALNPQYFAKPPTRMYNYDESLGTDLNTYGQDHRNVLRGDGEPSGGWGVNPLHNPSSWSSSKRELPKTSTGAVRRLRFAPPALISASSDLWFPYNSHFFSFFFLFFFFFFSQRATKGRVLSAFAQPRREASELRNFNRIASPERGTFLSNIRNTLRRAEHPDRSDSGGPNSEAAQGRTHVPLSKRIPQGQFSSGQPAMVSPRKQVRLTPPSLSVCPQLTTSSRPCSVFTTV
jgi:hypothetical protein